MKAIRSILCAGLSMAALSTFAQTQWAGNGHYYQFVHTSPGYWTDAKVAAESLSYLGLQGHLATPTSSAENQFIVSTFGWRNVALAWLGGYQNTSSPNYSEPAGGWEWVTGEPWSYTNWGPGNPSNGGAGAGTNAEGFLQFWYFGGNTGAWNDEAVYHTTDNTGYVVEYEASPVPEPSAFLVLALPIIGLLRTKTSKRQL